MSLVITGVYDGPITGGVPKGIELYVTADIADLSSYGVGSANNGGGTDGEEFTFPAIAASTGTYIYAASEAVEFANFFGFPPDFTDSAFNVNGDDAFELFENGTVIDTYGDINVDGNGEVWEYLDGWATRNPGTSASPTFNPADWTFSGPDALDDELTNATAATPVPLAAFDGDVPPPPPPSEFTLISTIQGTDGTQEGAVIGIDDRSALDGQTVTVSAIVTADYQDGLLGAQGDLNGFYIQEEEIDYDFSDLSSEGIFIFDGFEPLVDVQVGDLVEVTGVVSEFFGQTQISATEVVVVAQDQVVPDAVTVVFPTATVMADVDGNFVANLEAYEGMQVTVAQDMTITEMFNLDRFGQYNVSSDGQVTQFSQTNDPDVAGFAQHLRDTAARTVVLDDGMTVQNPAELQIIDGNDGVLTADDSFRMGDAIAGITGVVNYSFGEFRVQTPDGVYIENNARPETPENFGGNFTVASLNVLNYFTTIDENDVTTDIGENPRGADSAEEFARQADKLVDAIITMDADVLGLIEIENDFAGDDFAIKDLVGKVNAELGSEIYAFVDPGQEFVGGDAIANGLIYKVGSVGLQGDMAILTEFEGRDFIDPLDSGGSLNRAAIAQTFEDLDTGQTMTISVNHLKSKGSLSGLEVDESQGDGQGNNNATRTEAADILAAWLASDPTGQGSDNTLILGDLNAYAKEDPLTALADAGYTDLAVQALGDDAYSYVFDGQIGTLDYALANGALLDSVVGVTLWHINADEADAIDYNLDFGRDPALFNADNPARNSDHDPVIVSFDLAPVENIIAGTDRRDVLFGTEGRDLIDALLGDDVILAGDGDDDVNAGGGDDLVIGGAGNDVIQGLDGDDELDGGAGDDRIDGGDGYDIAFIDGVWTDFVFALDTTGGDVSISGQGSPAAELNGTDRLLDVEEIRFSFGSTASIAKTSTKVNVSVSDVDGVLLTSTAFDSGEAAVWTSLVKDFDANGDRTTQVVTYDDGRVYESVFEDDVRTMLTAYDAENAYSWDTFVRMFDEDGVTISQVKIYDDGRVYENGYVDGMRTTSSATDPNDVAPWATLDRTFEDGTIVTSENAIYDDGRVSVTAYVDGIRSVQSLTDVADAFVWNTTERTYDSEGVITSATATYDDGRVYETSYVDGVRDMKLATDVADVYNWLTRETDYDASGNRLSLTTTFDDGSVLVVDTGGAKTWTSLVKDFDANGDRTTQVVTYDDGRVYESVFEDDVRTMLTAYDAENAYSWDTFVRMFDEDGVTISQVKIYDDGRVYENGYVDGMRTTSSATDPNDVAPWATLDRTFEDGTIVTSENAIYDDGRVSVTAYVDGIRSVQSLTDVADAFVWNTTERTYDSEGVITSATATYDDGRVYETSYVDGVRDMKLATDVADVYNWLTRETDYDASGNRLSLTTTFDDGRVDIVVYDDTPIG